MRENMHNDVARNILPVQQSHQIAQQISDPEPKAVCRSLPAAKCKNAQCGKPREFFIHRRGYAGQKRSEKGGGGSSAVVHQFLRGNDGRREPEKVSKQRRYIHGAREGGSGGEQPTIVLANDAIKRAQEGVNGGMRTSKTTLTSRCIKTPDTPGSDVYAFACVCYEVPFHEFPNDMTVMFHVLDGKRPLQPSSCSGTPALDSLWELLEDCWKETPDKRPTAAQIVERLKSPLIQATTTQSTTDWNEQFSSKFRRSLQVQPLLPSVPQIERMIFGDVCPTEAAEGIALIWVTNNVAYKIKNHWKRGTQRVPPCLPPPASSPSGDHHLLSKLSTLILLRATFLGPRKGGVEPSREVIELLPDSDDERTVESGLTGASRDVGLQGSDRGLKRPFEEGSKKNLNQPKPSAKKSKP
ncbi:hypothetical protein C8R44DRAFT_855934 [Mycena epipterygia]|nr:hypothetical protein C8R44DRAFT_855934 [Mycena epipterygia]